MYKLPNGKIVYPEDIQCVQDPINGKGGIFIGNLQAAQNLKTLKKNGIKAVLTAAKGVFLNHSKTQIPHQLYIPGEDHERFDISKFFQQSITFIHEAVQHTNILVHCLAGVSRSVSLVIAYFIKHKSMTYQSVYSKIKSRRKIIHPNDGFISQLKNFEDKCKLIQANNIDQRCDHRSSYSPSKRYHGESYKVSPQKYYESPSKRGQQNCAIRRRVNDFKYTQMQNNNRFAPSFHVKNPEFYQSKFRQNEEFSKNVKTYSPDRALNQEKLKASFGLKRLSSMNVEQNVQGNNMRRSQIFKQYEFDVQKRGRGVSDYRPLDSIQNKDYSVVNTEIDKKIAQIRKKYQQYSKQQVQTKTRPTYQRKYSNMSSIYEPNENSADICQLKLNKRIASGIDYEQRRQNSGVGVIKNNYMPANMTNSMMGNRLKRMQSYQDY